MKEVLNTIQTLLDKKPTVLLVGGGYMPYQKQLIRALQNSHHDIVIPCEEFGRLSNGAAGSMLELTPSPIITNNDPSWITDPLFVEDESRKGSHFKASKFDRLNQMNAANRGFKG